MTEPGVCTLNEAWGGNEDRELLGLGILVDLQHRNPRETEDVEEDL